MFNKIKIKKILIALLVLVVLTIGFFVDINSGTSSLIIEKITDKTPEAKVEAYVRAIAENNKEEALSAWEIPDSYKLNLEYCDKIKNRGEQITGELIEKKIKSDFTITHIEWWSTCCMPRIIDNSRIAGKAKVYVQLTDSNNIKSAYIFDVIVPGGYEGGLIGHSVRYWVISDVYLEDEKNQFFK